MGGKTLSLSPVYKLVWEIRYLDNYNDNNTRVDGSRVK